MMKVRNGIVIAIAGVDGAGKSTIAEVLHEHYRGRMAVVRITPGRPQGSVLERIRRAVRGSSRVAEDGGPASPSSKTRVPGTRRLDLVSAIVLALLRLRMTRRARRLAQKGYMVIADRWPTDASGRMDGPKLSTGGAGGWTGRIAVLEARLYQRIEPADLCIWLSVPVELAIERNMARVKEGKESTDSIVRRHRENHEVRPIARRVIDYENTGTLESACRELIDVINDHIHA